MRITREKLTRGGFVPVCREADQGVTLEFFGNPATGDTVAVMARRRVRLPYHWRAPWWALPLQWWRWMVLTMQHPPTG